MQVPVAQPTVQSGGLPGVRQTSSYNPVAPSNNTDAFAAAQLGGQVANALGTVAGAGLKRQADEVSQASKIRVLDAVNQYKAAHQDAEFSPETGWVNVTGGDVFTQTNNKPLTDNVLDGLHPLRESIESSLSTDEQRALFKQHADELDLQTRGKVLQHEGVQYRKYAAGSLQAGQDVESKNILLNFNDIAAMKDSVAKIKQYGSDLGKLHGDGAEIGAIKGGNMASAALKSAMVAALDANDHASAVTILKEMSPYMDTNDVLNGYKLITKQAADRTAIGIVDEVFNEVRPAIVGGDGSRAWNILKSAESGGQQFDSSGKPTTSPKGAVGIAQIMLATGPEAAKLAGVPWDENLFRNDAAYNEKLGKAYFEKQLRDNNGDLAKAYAAYNAGPGALADAVKSAGNGWLSALPAETQNYVKKNLEAFNKGEGVGNRPTLADVEDAVLTKLGPDVDPDRRKLALIEAARQFKVQEDSIKQRGDDAVSESFRLLSANGGDFKSLPAHIQDSIPPTDYKRVMDEAARVAAGKPVATDYGLYYQLATDQELLRNTNLAALKDKLAPAEFKELTKAQAKVDDPKHESTTRSTKAILENYMIAAGIDPNTKKKDEADKIGKIWSFFQIKLDEAETAKGKPLNEQEIDELTARTFTKIPIKGTFWNSETIAPLASADDKVVIPEADRALITKQWAAKFPLTPITEGTLWELYQSKIGAAK